MVNNSFFYLSGGISGIIEIICVHPIEYYKTVKQLNDGNHSFIKYTQIKGIKDVYKGFFPRLIGIIPLRTVFWGTLNSTENLLKQNNVNQKYIPLIAGFVSGIAQTTIDCPIENIKTKNMVNENLTKIRFYGFLPNLGRNVFFSMIFNTQKKKMDNNKNNNILIGLICAIPASILTQPFDYLKTKKQFYGKHKTIKKIIQETNHIKYYWKGGTSRLLVTCLSMSIGLSVFNFTNESLFNNI